jgi:hypothetical protein
MKAAQYGKQKCNASGTGDLPVAPSSWAIPLATVGVNGEIGASVIA